MKAQLIIAYILILIVLVAYPFINEGMAEQSIKDIVRMQQKKKMKEFFYKFGFVGNDRVILLIMVLAFNSLPRMSSLYIWTFTPLMIIL